MKDYSAMSDFDIQQAVLQKTWGKHPVRLLGKMMLDIMLSDYDPCNNPADAWPIIISNGISLSPYFLGNEWIAAKFKPTRDNSKPREIELHYADRPLRAAMIVYLQMMEQKK